MPSEKVSQRIVCTNFRQETGHEHPFPDKPSSAGRRGGATRTAIAKACDTHRSPRQPPNNCIYRAAWMSAPHAGACVRMRTRQRHKSCGPGPSGANDPPSRRQAGGPACVRGVLAWARSGGQHHGAPSGGRPAGPRGGLPRDRPPELGFGPKLVSRARSFVMKPVCGAAGRTLAPVAPMFVQLRTLGSGRPVAPSRLFELRAPCCAIRPGK